MIPATVIYKLRVTIQAFSGLGVALAGGLRPTGLVNNNRTWCPIEWMHSRESPSGIEMTKKVKAPSNAMFNENHSA